MNGQFSQEIQQFVSGLPDAQPQDVSNQEKTPSQPTSDQKEDQKSEPKSDPSVLNSKISTSKAPIYWAPPGLFDHVSLCQFQKLLTLH